MTRSGTDAFVCQLFSSSFSFGPKDATVPSHARFALFLLTGAVASAQFKSTAALVIAPTTVTDSKGKYIDALHPADLVLYDNGVREPIQVDESYNPISLVVVVQTSATRAG